MFTSARDVLFLLVDVSVKSVLLALLAGLGLTLFRVRNSNVRHRIWMAVLLAMLVLPILIHVVPGMALPIDKFVAWFEFPADEIAIETPPAERATDELAVKAAEVAQALPDENIFPALPNSRSPKIEPRANRFIFPEVVSSPPQPTLPAETVNRMIGVGVAFYLAGALSLDWHHPRPEIRTDCNIATE